MKVRLSPLAVIQIVLITLKLCNILTCSWIIILLPLELEFIMWLILLLILFILSNHRKL